MCNGYRSCVCKACSGGGIKGRTLVDLVLMLFITFMVVICVQSPAAQYFYEEISYLIIIVVLYTISLYSGERSLLVGTI